MLFNADNANISVHDFSVNQEGAGLVVSSLSSNAAVVYPEIKNRHSALSTLLWLCHIGIKKKGGDRRQKETKNKPLKT